MKFQFTARIACAVPVSQDRRGFVLCGFLDVIATSEQEARSLAEKHLAEGKPLALSEAEIRGLIPRRTWEGRSLFIRYFWSPTPVADDRPIGVMDPDDDNESDDIPF
jgi:hypothetical protein